MHLKSCFALFGTLLLLCSTAVAQDECATAASISEGDTAFDTTGATDSADPLVCVGGGLGAMSGDLWFTYVAPCDGDLLVSTCDQAFDTDLAMYSGGCGALTCEAGSGDAPGCAGFTSEIAAHPVTGGTTYHIRVGAWGAGDTGTGTLTVALTPAVPGDECACALPIGTGDTALDTTLATTSADALGCAGGGLGSAPM